MELECGFKLTRVEVFDYYCYKIVYYAVPEESKDADVSYEARKEEEKLNMWYVKIWFIF